MTYAELMACAEAVAAWLLAHGVSPDCVVALQLHRSLEQVVGVVGVLGRAGRTCRSTRSGHWSAGASWWRTRRAVSWWRRASMWLSTRAGMVAICWCWTTAQRVR